MATLYTYLNDCSSTRLAGLAYMNSRRGRLSTSFAYDQNYLQDAQSYALDPELRLQGGNWPLSHEIPGCFADASPDRWGRNLIKRRYPQRSLTAMDYLLETSDITRQGALRFKTDPDGDFLHPESTIPKLVSLPELLSASDAVADMRDDEEAVRFLLAAGTASLGGARPKAVIEDQGRLFIAKFPHSHDETDVIDDEYRALVGAAKRGIDTPVHRLERIGEAKILLVERFDRVAVATDLRQECNGFSNLHLSAVRSEATMRVGYISAMTALGARDGEQRDYLEIIEFITHYGSRPKDDIRELLRRIRYTIEINNTDDHLRNHGFIHEKGGWHLSPVFDINPDLDYSKPRQTSLAGTVTEAESLKVLESLESRM